MSGDSSQPTAMRRLLGYVRPHRAALALGLVLALATTATGLAQPWAAKVVIEALGAERDVLRPVLVLLAIVLAGALLAAVHSWVLERTAERAVLAVRRQLAFRLIRLRLSVLDRQSPGGLVTRATSDSNLLRTAMSNGLVDLINGSLAMIGAIVLMAVLEFRLLLLTLLMFAIVGLVIGVILPRIRRAAERAQEGIGTLGSALDRALGAARTVKASGAEQRETATVERAAESAYHAGLDGAKYNAFAAAITGLAIEIPFLTVLGFGGVLVAQGALTLPTLIAFLLFLFYLVEPVTILISAVTALQQGLAAANRIGAVEDMEIEQDVDGTEIGAGSGPPEIELREVSFAYRPDQSGLSDVSLVVPAGARCALVGPSGAGKTTLLGLLQRFYDMDAGQILVDGRDITALSRVELRRAIGYVEQDAPALDGTLEENLRFAAPDASQADVDLVLATCRLTGLVERLPDGLATQVGPRGATLSGGERQRLAIARALLRRPRVLLLDEATSQLDARNEQSLRDALDSAATECTVVVIAHRLSTVLDSDLIAVVDQGRIRAYGTHQTLLSEDELYRELATTQLLTRD